MSGDRDSKPFDLSGVLAGGKVDVSAVASQLAQDPTLLAAVQQRCSELVGESSGYIESLPPSVQRRIKALKNLQLESTKIEQEFFAEVASLEAKFAAKYKPLFEKRADIVSGRYEPTDKECEWEDDDDEEDDDDDGDDKVDKKAKDSESANGKSAAKTASKEDADADDVNGIPSFWLTIFKNVEVMEDAVKEHDEPLLNRLEDIKVVYPDDKGLDFILEFHFSENEFFTNKVLTKSYVVECKVDEDDPFSFDGPSIVKVTGCKIDWKKGKNLTIKTVKKKQRHKGRGQTRTVTKTVPNESFFNFFSPPEPTANVGIDDDEEENATMEVLAADFARAEFLKDRVIPQAVLFFTGEALEDVADDEEDEEDEDEGLDGDDDEYDEDQDLEFDPSKVPQGQKPAECKQQ